MMTDLPEAYGRTRLTLMEVDPSHLYAYWEMTAEDWDRAGGRSTFWTLRFHEDGNHFDIPVDPTSPHRFLELPGNDRAYYAELGVLGDDGRYAPVCRSNVVQLPRSSPSPRYDPAWMSVPEEEARTPEPAPAIPLEAPPPEFGLSS